MKKKFFNSETLIFTIIMVVMMILLISVGVQFIFNSALIEQGFLKANIKDTVIFVVWFFLSILILGVSIIYYYLRIKTCKNNNRKEEKINNAEIVCANENDFNDSVDFYNKVIDKMNESQTNFAFWEKGFHPSENYLKESICNKTLYLVKVFNKIVGAFVINENPEGNYSLGRWKNNLKNEECLIVHTFCVDSDYRHKGLSQQMLNYIKLKAKTLNKKAVRLDVTLYNSPAMKLFESNGFTSAGAFDLGRNIKGILAFQLYEYNL